MKNTFKTLLIFIMALTANVQMSAQSMLAAADSVKPMLRIGAPLKAMKLQKLDNSWVNTSEIPKDKQVMFVLLNLTCGHCREATQDLVKHITEFPNTYILLATGDIMRDYYQEFCDVTHYIPSDSFVVSFDPNHETDELFAFRSVPQIMIYGTDKKLKSVFYKEQSIAALKAALAGTDATPKRKKRHKKY
jgi:hypothetical protein